MDATGELVTGTLVARAIERTRGERHQDSHAHGACLNCGTALVGSYCHRCGQPEHIHRSLSAIWHDLAHSVFHFEGKVWNTLPLLAWRPGELTRRFVHGERARFVSPMALFLFSAFLMFALFSAIGAHMKVPERKPLTPEQVTKARAELPRAETKLQAARQELARVRAAHGDRDGAAEKVDSAAEDAAMLRLMAKGQSPNIGDLNIDTGWPALDRGLLHAKENPNLLLYKIQSSAYKFSWALIPISTPFLWLLFAWRRQFKLYDHAVFVTYSLAFMSLFVILLTLLSQAGVGRSLIVGAVLLIPPVHMYRQLRGAYGIGRISASLRTMALLVFAAWALSAYGFLLVTLGVMG